MKNYSLNNLIDYDTHILSDRELKHYSQPIIAIAEQKRLPIKVPTACDNTTLIRIDIEPHNLYTDLEKLQREFSSLLTRYPKSFFKINGEKLSFYRPKENRTVLHFKKLLDSEEYDDFIKENPNSLPICYGETVIKKRLVKEGDKVNDKIVLDNIAYDIAAFCFDKGRASRAVVRQFLGTGDGPAIRRINKLMHYKIIGDYNQEQKRHPFLITEEQFYNTFIALREVNNA